MHEAEQIKNEKLHFMSDRVQQEAAEESYEQAFILLMQAIEVVNGFFGLKGIWANADGTYAICNDSCNAQGSTQPGCVDLMRGGGWGGSVIRT